jgi:ribosome-binding protein aMBF1 (putative translation factor)
MTDWERLRNMTEEETDAGAASDLDNPPRDEGFMRDARTVYPDSTRWETIRLHIDVDLLEWFKARRFRFRTRSTRRSVRTWRHTAKRSSVITRNQRRHQREDLEAVARVESDSNQDRIPLAVVKRLLDDENPLKVWREHRGLTQQALADAAGLPQSTIARLESGERKGAVDQMRKLAGALGINLDTLCEAS